MDLPQTLHAQLYLLAYDRERHRFGGHSTNAHWLIGFALRAAMLTDLYLTGYLEDKDGNAHPARTARHPDPVLRESLADVAGQNWAHWIAHRERDARRIVCDDLEAMGWVDAQPRRMLGLVAARVRLYDDDMVSALARRVNEALRNALDDRPADPRPLALGLLAVEAQMPVVSHFLNDAGRRGQVHQMALAAIEPIVGLHQAVVRRFSDHRSDGGCGGGGCSGGGS